MVLYHYTSHLLPAEGSHVVNISRLDKAFASIDAGEREWDQFDWRCGTGGCLAAHAGLVSGWVWAFTHGNLMRRSNQPVGDLVDVSEMVSARVVAIRELDLTNDQAEALFHEQNTRLVLQALRDCLAVQPNAGYQGLRALAKEVRKSEMAERKAKVDAQLAGTDPQRTPRGWQQVDS
jgi:hypothetical protein